MANAKETPRQKMIGMMYLVLTCLLALNVSKEILEGFVTINESLETNNASITSNTRVMMNSFEDAIKKGHHDVKPYYACAKQVNAFSENAYQYVEKLKREVKAYTENTEGADTMRLSSIEQLDNFDKPTFLLLGSDEKQPKSGPYSAKELREVITGFAGRVDSLITAMKNTTGLKLPEEDYSSLKARISALKPHDRYKNKEGKDITWEFKNFYNMPLASVVTNLSKIQSDIRNLESDMINAFAAASTKMMVKLDLLEARIVPVSQYVQAGTPYTAEVFLTATSSDFKEDNLQFILGDVDTATGKMASTAVLLPVEKGSGKISRPGTVTGDHEVKGWIKFKDKNGRYQYYSWSNQYVIANPAVAVSADKMNVMYLGVENDLSISAAGVAPTDLVVKAVGAGATLVQKGPGKYEAKVTSAGNCTISVYKKDADGLKIQGQPKVFRVKRIPDPQMKVQGRVVVSQTDFSAPQAQILSGISVDNSNFDYNAPFKVKSFTLGIFSGSSYQEFKCSNGQVSAEASSALKRVKRGSKIFFEDIKISGPDGERSMPMIKVNVKQ